MVRDLLIDYIKLIVDNGYVLIKRTILERNCKSAFPKDKYMVDDLRKYSKMYFESAKRELGLISLILINERKLYIDDIDNALYELESLQIDKHNFINDIFIGIEDAIDMDYKYKYFRPRNKMPVLDEQKVKELITIAKGFSKEGLDNFLIREKVYTEKELEQLKDKERNLDIDRFKSYVDAIKSDIDVSCIVVPKIVDQNTMLINIGQYVNFSMLANQSLDDDLKIDNVDIPLFYQALFCKRNDFITEKIPLTELSKILLKEYKNEPFEEQLKKYKYYASKNRY